MPIYEDLRIIGKFAIIEALLTSRKSIQMNSINFQLQNKIALLNNRFSKPVEFSKYCKLTADLPIQTIIEKLYSYRSCIAHGNEPDFKDKLQILVNSLQADYCVDEICRKVLMQTILEPNLIADLRNC